MTATTKFAVSIPKETFAAVERVRKRLGKSRSAAVSLALEQWLRMADLSDADRRYIDGYRAQPEDSTWAKTAAASTTWGQWSEKPKGEKPKARKR